jgi:hypothetical protein
MCGGSRAYSFNPIHEVHDDPSPVLWVERHAPWPGECGYQPHPKTLAAGCLRIEPQRKPRPLVRHRQQDTNAAAAGHGLQLAQPVLLLGSN